MSMNAILSRCRRFVVDISLSERSRWTSAVAATVAAAALVTISDDDEQRKRDFLRLSHTSSMCEASLSKEFKDGPKLIFLGSGSSTGCPVGVCTLTLTQRAQNAESPNDQTSNSSKNLAPPKCQVSHLASQGDPKFNKNYRNNPSFLIHHYQPETKSFKNVIIDVGKTFREGALRWFPEFHIHSLDSIILTHEHMDAAAGLDDVRGFQKFEAADTSGRPPKRIPVPVYLSRHCHDKLQGQFPFLFPKLLSDSSDHSGSPSTAESMASSTKPSKPVVLRDVAGFLVNIFESYKAMQVEGLNFIPLPVWHGDDLISYGFAFSVPTSTTGKSINVVYLSDISRMVPDTMEFIQQKLPPTDILIVDALLWRRKHPTHFSLEQAVELRDQLKPRMQTYLVGMSCENFPPQDEMQDHLDATYGDITMAYDGLAIPLDEL